MTPAAQITPELVREDAHGRIAKTGGQNGVAVAIVTVVTYAAWKAGLLKSMDDLPTLVHDAFVFLLTVGASWFTNLSRLRAK